jgi:cation:H+ antiporter
VLSLIPSFLILCLGFAVLGFGADTLVTGAASMAKRFGLSARLIGLTIIATGTSLPEIAISLHTALLGDPIIAVGNAIGSNIANMGLVLGITVLLVPLEIRSETLQKEWPILFLVIFVVGLLMIDGTLSRVDGGLLIVGGGLMIWWLIHQGLKHGIFQRDVLGSEYQKEIETKVPILKPVFQMLFGFLMLPLGSSIIVKHAIEIANFFNVSHLTMGLTLLALGTSLPELATSIAGARKKEYDIIIGNILGSNIFNLLAVLALPVLIKPLSLHVIMLRDYIVMFLLTSLCFAFAFRLNKKRYMSRMEGGFLVSIYVFYLSSMIFLH